MPQVLNFNEQTGEIEMVFSEEEKSAIFNKAMNEMFEHYIQEQQYEVSAIASKIFVFRDNNDGRLKILNVTTEEQYQEVIKIMFKYMENGGWFDEYLENYDDMTPEMKAAFDGEFVAIEQAVNRYQGEEGLNWWIQEFVSPESFDQYLNEEFED